MIKVSFGNKKLPKDTMIFNIPARVTCPGRTELCSNSCYALKAERMYKKVLPARQHNLIESRRDDFAEQVNTVLFSKRHRIERVRIHESGDFYNQAYLDKWYRIAALNPAVTFYAYTKSFNLDFSKRPANFWLIASFDKSTTPDQRARYDAQRQHFQNSFTIVDRHDESASCIQDCSKCDVCWTGSGKALTVNQH